MNAPPSCQSDSPVPSKGQASSLRDLGLALECKELLEDLGFHLTSEELRELGRKSVEFFEEAFDEKYEELAWQKLAVKREMLRALVGWWKEKIAEAHRLGTSQELREVLELVAFELSTPREGFEHCSAKRLRFDVGAWNLRRGKISGLARYRHLHVIAELARLQESALLEGEKNRSPAAILRDALVEASR